MTTKGITSPGSGTLNWDVPLNANFTAIEKAFGDSVNITATSGSYPLNASQMGNMALRCVGALTADLTIQIASGTAGQWVVVNATTDATGGPFKVFVSSLAGGTPIEIDRGTTRSVYSDGTANGVVLADTTLAGTANIKDGAVTTAKIADGAVTVAKMAFPPVEQGGGTDMGSSKLRLGWRSDGLGIQAQVDATPLGVLMRNTQTPAGQNQELIAPGGPPVYGCRAWVNFNGGDGVVRAGGNVASVTRGGPGDYLITFSSPMPDANYAWAGSLSSNHGQGSATENVRLISLSPFAIRVQTVWSNPSGGGNFDPTYVTLQFFR